MHHEVGHERQTDEEGEDAAGIEPVGRGDDLLIPALRLWFLAGVELQLEDRCVALGCDQCESEGNMRQALMAAAQLARSATQARQDAAQRATRRDLEEARHLQAQLDAQRVAARAELAPVHESSWWDQAKVRDVARAYETAVTYRDED